jgi:hypothetical protein
MRTASPTTQRASKHRCGWGSMSVYRSTSTTRIMLIACCHIWQLPCGTLSILGRCHIGVSDVPSLAILHSHLAQVRHPLTATQHIDTRHIIFPTWCKAPSPDLEHTRTTSPSPTSMHPCRRVPEYTVRVRAKPWVCCSGTVPGARRRCTWVRV